MEAAMIQLRLLPTLVIVLLASASPAHAQDDSATATLSKPAVNKKCDS
jgi:hypothetical protein